MSGAASRRRIVRRRDPFAKLNDRRILAPRIVPKPARTACAGVDRCDEYGCYCTTGCRCGCQGCVCGKASS